MNLFLAVIKAQNTIGNPSLGDLGTRFNPDNSAGYFSSLISMIVSAILIAGTLIFFIMFLIGGVRWIMAGGDKANTEGARGTLTNAFVGLIVMFAAWAIITLIENVFGISILSFDIPLIGNSVETGWTGVSPSGGR